MINAYRLILTAAIPMALAGAGCGPKSAAEPADTGRANTATAIPLTFTAVTDSAGIKFRHNNGAFGAKPARGTDGVGGCARALSR